MARVLRSNRTAPTPLPIADGHSDLLMELVGAELRDGERNPMSSRWLPPLERGGVALQVCAIYVEPGPPGRRLLEATRQLDAYERALASNPDRLLGVTSAADLDAVGDGRMRLLLALEGLDWFGDDVALLDAMHRRGVRMASLTHNPDNAFAGGCGSEEGLTPLGAQVVERMSRLAIAVDLAHASERTFWEVLDRELAAPPLVSHACCAALHPHPRNLTDRQLTALAERDGVVGLMPHPYVVDPVRRDLDRFADHVEHALATVGPRHLALGGDFLRQIARALQLSSIAAPGAVAVEPDAALDGLEGPQDYPALVARLRARGIGEDDLAALLCGNLTRLLRQTLGAGAP